MKVIDFLKLDAIIAELAATTKAGTLSELANHMARLDPKVDASELRRVLEERELLASTAIGDGIAVPHVRNPIVLNVSRPMVTLCFLERPVDFGALDGKPVHVLFSLICPTTRSHLQMLSRLSFALHDPQLKAVVLRQGPREEVLREARRVEAGLAAPAAAEGKATP